MSPSISFRELTDDTDAVLDRLAAHNDGIVISYDGEDVARITPLSAEERAWRRTLIAEGADPDAPENTMDLHVPDADRSSEPEPEREPDGESAPAEEPESAEDDQDEPRFAAHEYGAPDPDMERPIDAASL